MAAAQEMAQPGNHNREARKAAIASVVGNALEWYDFFLYGTAAALVFNTLCLPRAIRSISERSPDAAGAVPIRTSLSCSGPAEPVSWTASRCRSKSRRAWS